MTGGQWTRYHEPKFLRNERKVIEETLQQIMNNRNQEDLRQGIGPIQTGRFIPPTRHAEQWTVDSFWKMDRLTPVQPNTQDMPGQSTSSSSRSYNQLTPMDEGGIDSETDQDPIVLEVPATN